MRDLMQRYTWADDPSLDLVWCISVVEGSDVVTVVRVFGGDPNRSQLMTFSEAEAEAGKHFGQFFNIQVFSDGPHVVALENNGWSGTVPEIARRASANGGRFLSNFYNVNANNRIVQAIDGQVVAFFEPMFVNNRDKSHPWRPTWVEDIEFPVGQLQAACLALMERQTGLAFDRQWLDKKLPTYRIPDPDVMLKDVENARLP